MRAAHFHRVDHDETVHDVGKRAVDIERQHLAAAVQILAQQRRDAFSIGLQIGHGVGKLLDIVEKIGQQPRIAAAQPWRAELAAGLDVTRQIAIAAALP